MTGEGPRRFVRKEPTAQLKQSCLELVENECSPNDLPEMCWRGRPLRSAPRGLLPVVWDYFDYNPQTKKKQNLFMMI